MRKLSKEELLAKAKELRKSASSAIKIAQETVRLRMDKGFIQPPPK